ncbi:hypothetical protein [Clostridium sp. AM58-1XD]|uniref:DNA polymerase Y family protein n=1 Tax=Clostridium sp. AM58-1XD TaxID=2292307 RepID=UPI00268CC90C
MTKERLIFHIDVNSAFLSWESVYRLEQDPEALDLRTVPSAVGGDAKQRHGIILAKSTPAKKYGITTGEPIVQALRKCPELLIVPSCFELYVENSRKLIRLLEEYTPDIEKFSIDEAFLDMSSTIHLFGDPVSTADRLRERIRQELGFTVNVGIALTSFWLRWLLISKSRTRHIPFIPAKFLSNCGRFRSGNYFSSAEPLRKRWRESAFIQ